MSNSNNKLKLIKNQYKHLTIDDRAKIQTLIEQLDDNGKRKYAQLNNRWWDNSTGTQKEHLICWFSRKYYTDGSTQKCIEDNYSRCCKDCYFKKNNQISS